MRSLDLSKNFLTALTDLVLTVRGSVSNEYPALGIPALQSGWSEWSKCGFTEVAETPEEYFRMLEEHIEGCIAGKVLITPEQVERARLWAWFYRSGSDVSSGLVQQWQVGEGDELFDLLHTNMLQTEVDAEPAFTAVRRMWRRRDPFLTRIDWRSRPRVDRRPARPGGCPVSPVSSSESNVFRLPSLHLGTDVRRPDRRRSSCPGTLGRGSDSALCILDGANRAPHRLSRMVRPVGLLGIKLGRAVGRRTHHDAAARRRHRHGQLGPPHVRAAAASRCPRRRSTSRPTSPPATGSSR